MNSTPFHLVETSPPSAVERWIRYLEGLGYTVVPSHVDGRPPEKCPLHSGTRHGYCRATINGETHLLECNGSSVGPPCKRLQ